MKKAIAYLLSLVLCLSLLSGCGKPTVYYKSYSTSMYADLDVFQQVSDYYGTFSPYKFWFASGDELENKNPTQTMSVKIGDLQLVGEYKGLALVAWGKYGDDHSYLRDEYRGDGYTFYVRRETGQLVYLSIPATTEMRKLPNLENPREDTERIARELAAEWSRDLSAYTFTFNRKEERGAYDVYHYSFQRYINDIPTADFIEIDITSKGTIDLMMREEIDAFKNLTFDMSAVEESVDKCVHDAWEKCGFSVVSYEMESRYPYVCLTIDKQAAIVSELRLQLIDPNGNEREAGMNVVTLVSTDSNKVIATRPNPYAQ